jgi:hypothetical protein
MIRVRHVIGGKSSIHHYSRCERFDTNGCAFVNNGGEFVFEQQRENGGFMCYAFGPSGDEICHHYCVAGTDPGASLDALIAEVSDIGYCEGHAEAVVVAQKPDDFD